VTQLTTLSAFQPMLSSVIISKQKTLVELSWAEQGSTSH